MVKPVLRYCIAALTIITTASAVGLVWSISVTHITTVLLVSLALVITCVQLILTGQLFKASGTAKEIMFILVILLTASSIWGSKEFFRVQHFNAVKQSVDIDQDIKRKETVINLRERLSESLIINANGHERVNKKTASSAALIQAGDALDKLEESNDRLSVATEHKITTQKLPDWFFWVIGILIDCIRFICIWLIHRIDDQKPTGPIPNNPENQDDTTEAVPLDWLHDIPEGDVVSRNSIMKICSVGRPKAITRFDEAKRLGFIQDTGSEHRRTSKKVTHNEV